MPLFARSKRRASLDRDLRDEVECHLSLRAQQYREAGATPEAAETLARGQFGNVEAIMKDMRDARRKSVATAVAVSTLLAAATVVWTLRSVTSPGNLPELPPTPMVFDFKPRPKSPPPPPPPPPTWEEFVAKVNTFGRSASPAAPGRR